MTAEKTTLLEVVNQLATEGLLDRPDAKRATSFLESRSMAQPWYVRAMVGTGAWLASLLLVGFVAGFTIALDGGYAFVGIALIATGLFVRRQNDNDFLVQGSLALSLAGQALVAWGIVDAVGGDEFEVFLSLIIVMSTVLFFIFPDRIHRVMMVLFVTTSVTTLFYVWELNALVPILGPIFAVILVLVHDNQSKIIGAGLGRYLRPLMNGFMLSAFGTLLLSTIYVLPELGGAQLDIYPRPWISTLILGAPFLYVGTRIGSNLTGPNGKVGILTIGALLSIIIAGSWAAPGLLLALVVVMLGAETGHKTFIGAGIAFLAVFLAAYFYGIELTMQTKSITLVITGITVLAVRWIVLTIMGTDGQGGEHNA